LELTTDYPRPSTRSFTGATYGFSVDPQLAKQLKSLAERSGATLYMVLLAAFKVLLHRYTGQEDICVGTLIANRQYGETEGLIGCLLTSWHCAARWTGTKDSLAYCPDKSHLLRGI